MDKENVRIRPFRNTRADAEGILAVEMATFAESPYDAGQVQALLANGRQHAWLAVDSQRVVGFVISFLTEGLHRPWWEIDLLAVLPAWRGRRLATRMIQAAAETGATQARWTRAFAADDNTASARAFCRAGFHQAPELFELLIFRTEDQAPSFRPAADILIRIATGGEDLALWLGGRLDVQSEGDGQPRGTQGSIALPGGPTFPTVFLAERDGRPVGYAELVGVETLLYRGFWIEELTASDRLVRQALVQEVTRHAQQRGADEIGAMVPHSNGRLRTELLCTGYRSLGSYYQLTAELPLPKPDPVCPSRPQGADLV